MANLKKLPETTLLVCNKAYRGVCPYDTGNMLWQPGTEPTHFDGKCRLYYTRQIRHFESDIDLLQAWHDGPIHCKGKLEVYDALR